MAKRVQRVRIDRVVLRGVDLNMHDAAALPAWLAAELTSSTEARGGKAVVRSMTQDLAAEIASRVRFEIDQ